MRKAGGPSFKESNVDKGMVLPFNPLTMTFNNVHYFVDCPPVSVATSGPVNLSPWVKVINDNDPEHLKSGGP